MTTTAAVPRLCLWCDPPPCGWSVTRVKSCFRDSTGSITVEQLADLEVDHYSIPAFDEFGAPAREQGAAIASNKTLLRGGELLFSKLNSHKPRVWLVPTDESVKVASTEFVALCEWHRGSVSKAFVRHLLGSAVFARYISCFQTSVTNSHKRISPEDLWRTAIPLPPLPEQSRIAAYLDASCAALDTAVAAKRRQMDTLDALRRVTVTKAVTLGLNPTAGGTKPSGQEWLGPIPRHWEALSLKRLLREPLAYGLNEAAELDDRELPRYLRITDFDDDGTLRDETFRSLPWEVAREAMLQPDDVLFARSGATVGKTFIFPEGAGPACFAGYLIQARTLPWKLNPQFLYLFTKSLAYDAWKGLIFTQATIQNISAAKYDYLTVPVPPLAEQRQIVEFLNGHCDRSAQLRTNLDAQIQTLLAYRKSLIHECVTGQRRVTDADVAQAEASYAGAGMRGFTGNPQKRLDSSGLPS